MFCEGEVFINLISNKICYIEKNNNCIQMYSSYSNKTPSSAHNRSIHHSSSKTSLVKHQLSSIRKNKSPLSYSSKEPSQRRKQNNNKTSINSNLSEEQIEIKIPTPYPKAQFMTIDDPSLQSGEYTSILNEKYPPRQYLKHNSQSFNKVAKFHNKDIKITLLNPQLNFKDYNLKSITYKNEEIDEKNITNLSDALEIINRLKGKLIDYEVTNNANIEKANETIKQLQAQNDLYIKKLNEIYNNIDIIKEKYGIDVDFPNPEDPMNMLIKSFREKWLKKNFMNVFKYRVNRQIEIKNKYYNNFLERKKGILKLKALIGFEKLQNVIAFKKNLSRKRDIVTKRNILYDLKRNVILNQLKMKFGKVQKNLYQLLYIKELKLKAYKRKAYCSANRKALMNYFIKTSFKVMGILKFNAQMNKENNTKPTNKKSSEDTTACPSANLYF